MPDRKPHWGQDAVPLQYCEIPSEDKGFGNAGSFVKGLASVNS
jgi:hypothetical protein